MLSSHGCGKLDALSIPIPGIQRPHLQCGANRMKMVLPQCNGCSGAGLPHGASANPSVYPLCCRGARSPAAGPMESIRPGRVGIRGT